MPIEASVIEKAMVVLGFTVSALLVLGTIYSFYPNTVSIDSLKKYAERIRSIGKK